MSNSKANSKIKTNSKSLSTLTRFPNADKAISYTQRHSGFYRVSFDGGKTLLDIQDNNSYSTIQSRCQLSKVWIELIKQMERDMGIRIRKVVQTNENTGKKEHKQIECVDNTLADKINEEIRRNPNNNTSSLYKKRQKKINRSRTTDSIGTMNISPIINSTSVNEAGFQIDFTTISSLGQRMRVLQSYLSHCSKDLIIDVDLQGNPLGETKRKREEEEAKIKETQRQMAKEEGWVLDENYREKEKEIFEQKKAQLKETEERMKQILLYGLGEDYRDQIESRIAKGIILEGPGLKRGRRRNLALGKDKNGWGKKEDYFYYDEEAWKKKFESPVLRTIKEKKEKEAKERRRRIAEESQRIEAKGDKNSKFKSKTSAFDSDSESTSKVKDAKGKVIDFYKIHDTVKGDTFAYDDYVEEFDVMKELGLRGKDADEEEFDTDEVVEVQGLLDERKDEDVEDDGYNNVSNNADDDED